MVCSLQPEYKLEFNVQLYYNFLRVRIFVQHTAGWQNCVLWCLLALHSWHAQLLPPKVTRQKCWRVRKWGDECFTWSSKYFLCGTSFETDLDHVLSSLRTNFINAHRVLVYCQSLDTCADLFAHFHYELGDDSYYPPGSPHLSDYRLFGMFHASTTRMLFSRAFSARQMMEGKESLAHGSGTSSRWPIL